MAERNHLTAPARAEGGTERSAEEIRQDIAAKRESITETVDRLSDRVQQTFDWRTYVADYPLIALGAAAGVGWLLSSIFKPRPSPRERIMDALAESIEDVTDRLRHNLDNLPHQRKGVGRTVKAAATAMVTKAAVDYVKNRLDGAIFQQRDGSADRSPYNDQAQTGASAYQS
jgi:ElaB/YqjD/DUF883 family membrane-anchored ribosome-binding protein